jgi:hypothetical protein
MKGTPKTTFRDYTPDGLSPLRDSPASATLSKKPVEMRMRKRAKAIMIAAHEKTPALKYL